MAREILGVLTPVGGGDPIELTLDELLVGRRDSCDLILSHPNVSSTHCRLSYRMGKWVVEDLRSSNGVKVNGERLMPNAPKTLAPGDEISFAKHAYVLEYTPGEGAEFVDEITNVFEQSLMEKAGLQKPKARKKSADDE